MSRQYIPDRGDLIWTDFNPASGHEQLGKRPALVLSTRKFNKAIRLALVAPVTSRVRGHGFEVPINGEKVSGVALCQQVKMIDFLTRGATLAEKADKAAVADALARVQVIISEEE